MTPPMTTDLEGLIARLRLYQQELVGVAFEQRSARLANIADAIGRELVALSHYDATRKETARED